jgi:N-carbamoylputrescine amidase
MVRVALAQFSGHESKDVNVRKAEDLARQAAGNGARIICFPELATTVYFCFDRDRKWFAAAEPVPGPAVNRLAAVARETSTVIVYPLYENDHGTLYNTAAVIGPDGNLIGRYRKMSIPQILRTVRPGETPGDERFFFSPGNLGFPVFDTPFGIKIGILICYDRHFPEAARILALRGAHLLLVPTATYREWIREVWEIELRGHAIANMFYVGGVNKVGPDVGGAADRHYFGSALFIDPRGNVIARAGDKQDEILYADVDPKVCEDVRSLWGFFDFRRPDAYADILEGRVAQDVVRA